MRSTSKRTRLNGKNQTTNMFTRVLRNIAVFLAFDISRSLIAAHDIGMASLGMIMFVSLAGLLRPAEALLLVLLAKQFFTKGRGSAGFKVQLTAILIIAFGYLFTLETLVEQFVWSAIIAWMTYDWWTIPVVRRENQPDTARDDSKA